MKLNSKSLGTFSFPTDYTVVRVATLNKSDLLNGANKFYLIEAHTSKDGKKFRLYSRYGRVGHHGTEEERIPDQDRPSLDDAFNSLLKEKTSPRKGYVEVKVAQSKMGSSVAQTMVLSDDVKKDKITSTSAPTNLPPLHNSIERLVLRLYNEAGKAVQSQLSGTLKTTAENPLGTLTLTQIGEGSRILGEVQSLLSSKPTLKDSIDKRILDLSNQFYSAIPQTMALRPKSKEGKTAMDSWLKGMALNNAKILDEKQELLDLLSDVQGMVGGFATSDVHAKYKEIGCEYEYLPPSDPEHKRVEQYAQKTRSRHHGWQMSVKNIWRVDVKGQRAKHDPCMKRIGNVQELFHGSRPGNILGISKHGLLMRPPGAVVTGSMFGPGLYFADCSSKSEQYSMARFGGGGSSHGDTYFMFVANVALGKVKDYVSAQMSLQKAPSGYDSVQGKKSNQGSQLLHDEFIIYDIQQHNLQHLIEFQTH